MNNVIKGIKLILSGLLSPFKIVINGVKELMYVSSRLQHIEDNLMYDATPDELNKRITSVAKQVDQNRTRYNLVMVHESQLKQIESDIKELKNGAQVLIDCVNAGKSLESEISELKIDVELNKKLGKLASEDRINNRLDAIDKRFKGVNRDINELQLSLEDMKPKDLGKFNFINYEPTQIELAQIEAELAGEKIARQEYDYAIEDRARNKQIQDRMRADEAEYDRLSEPDNDGIIW